MKSLIGISSIGLVCACSTSTITTGEGVAGRGSSSQAGVGGTSLTSSAAPVNRGGMAGTVSSGQIGGFAGAVSTIAGLGGASLASVGGVTNVSAGGSVANGGTTSAVAATGGAALVSVATGGIAAGGTQTVVVATGGIPASAGSSGTVTAECERDSDCVNPDAVLCSATCVNGTCQTASMGTAFSSGSLSGGPRTAFWDANNKPFLITGHSDGTPANFGIQPLLSDGGLGGTVRTFSGPSGSMGIDALGASYANGRLGLLWHTKTKIEGDQFEWATFFSVTDATGTPSTSARLSVGYSTSKYPEFAYTEFVYPVDSQKWAALEFGASYPAVWRGYVVDPSSPPASPPFSEYVYALGSAPVAGTAGVIPQSAAVVGARLYLSGFDCDWREASGPCQPYLILARYDKSTLKALDPTRVVLSTTPVNYGTRQFRAPALGGVRNKLAVLWTEFTSNDQIELGRAILNDDGSLVSARSLVASDLIPKALIETDDGNVLLFASRVDKTAPTPVHTLVVQRLNASLAFIGTPQAIGAASASEPTEVGLHPSKDGSRILVTFSQDTAQHRIIQSHLCQ